MLIKFFRYENVVMDMCLSINNECIKFNDKNGTKLGKGTNREPRKWALMIILLAIVLSKVCDLIFYCCVDLQLTRDAS